MSLSQTYLSLEAFIKATNALMTFHGEDNIVRSFSHCYLLRIYQSNMAVQILVEEEIDFIIWMLFQVDPSLTQRCCP